MTIWNAILLGLVQGIAEFLPISSSGHLSILQNLFHMSTAEDGHLFFDVLLHLGTLVSICIVYWRDIVAMVRETFAFFGNTRLPAEQRRKQFPAARMVLMIILATLPLFLILPINDKVEQLYYHTFFIGLMLILTGCLLFVADKIVETVPKETLAVQLSEELFERDYTKIWEAIQNFRKENGQKPRRRRRRRKTKKQA